MNARLSHIEREVLERAISDSMPIADSDQILATVEAILLARQLRAQPGPPMSHPARLRAAPPSETYTTPVNQPGAGRVLHLNRHAKT